VFLFSCARDPLAHVRQSAQQPTAYEMNTVLHRTVSAHWVVVEDKTNVLTWSETTGNEHRRNTLGWVACVCIDMGWADIQARFDAPHKT